MSVSGGDGGADGASGSDASATLDAGGDRAIVVDARTRDVVIDNDPRCPSFGDASGHCSQGLSCVYPEGRCVCAGYCGGPAPDPNTDYTHWACEAWRTNGCPDDPPQQGTGCSQEGVHCGYGSCCVFEAICERGSWVVANPVCPP